MYMTLTLENDIHFSNCPYCAMDCSNHVSSPSPPLSKAELHPMSHDKSFQVITRVGCHDICSYLDSQTCSYPFITSRINIQITMSHSNPNIGTSTSSLHADDALHVVTDVAPPLHLSTTFRYPENPEDLVPLADLTTVCFAGQPWLCSLP